MVKKTMMFEARKVNFCSIEGQLFAIFITGMRTNQPFGFLRGEKQDLTRLFMFLFSLSVLFVSFLSVFSFRRFACLLTVFSCATKPCGIFYVKCMAVGGMANFLKVQP